MKKLTGNSDIEDSLDKLDKLTQKEARMASTEQLKMTPSVDRKLIGVNDSVKGVEEKVQDVRDGMHGIGDKDQGVDDRVQDIDDKLYRASRSSSR